MPNYGVSLAQSIIPAADVSVQISTAGKEASGTSNMKFALNGALTVGTLDGANVEIREAVGPDNFFLFGLTADEVARCRAARLRPRRLHRRAAPRWREALALIESRLLQPRRTRTLSARSSTACATTTRYMVCADFDAYVAAEARAAEVYRDRVDWSRRALLNIAGASRSRATTPSASTRGDLGRPSRDRRSWGC